MHVRHRGLPAYFWSKVLGMEMSIIEPINSLIKKQVAATHNRQENDKSSLAEEVDAQNRPAAQPLLTTFGVCESTINCTESSNSVCTNSATRNKEGRPAAQHPA